MGSLNGRNGRKQPSAAVLHGAYCILLVVAASFAYSSGKNAASGNNSSSIAGSTVLGLGGSSNPKRAWLTGQKDSDLEPIPFYVPPAASELRKLATLMQPVTDKIGAASIPAAPNAQHTYDALYSPFKGLPSNQSSTSGTAYFDSVKGQFGLSASNTWRGTLSIGSQPVPALSLGRSKYFEVNNQRMRKLKMLEIGLGCNMHYGPGASASLWRRYMPNAEIWFAEYDSNCLLKHMPNLTALNLKAVSGDQADNATLARWLKETGGNFDVIIDDGGHMNDQIFNSFATLFHKGLKPGGVYFIEDLIISHTPEYRGTAGSPVMANVLSDWVESILAAPAFARLDSLRNRTAMQPAYKHYNSWKTRMQKLVGDSAYVPDYKLPIGVKLIECAAEMCAVVKCTEDDPFCPDGIGKQPFETL